MLLPVLLPGKYCWNVVWSPHIAKPRLMATINIPLIRRSHAAILPRRTKSMKNPILTLIAEHYRMIRTEGTT